MKKFFAILSIFAATCTVANAQNPVVLSYDSDTIQARDYETYAKIAQTNRVGNTYNRYLVRKDPTTGEKQRYLLSSKPITGPVLGISAGAHMYNKNVTPLPMVIFGWHAAKWEILGQAGLGLARNMDPESDQYKNTYWSFVGRLSAIYKVWSSAADDQMLEKWYVGVGAFAEYDNRRNSSAEVIETVDMYTKNEDKVQGSSYAFGPKIEIGRTFAKSGSRLSLGVYAGVGRDYKKSGTITVFMGGVELKYTVVLSKTHKTKLGQRVLR